MQVRLKQLDGVIDTALERMIPQWDDTLKLYKPGRRNNEAAVDPTTAADNTLGYETGSVWVNTATDNAFICVDAATGAAVWIGVGVSGEPKQEEYAGDAIATGDPDTVLTAAPAHVPVSAECINLYMNGVLQRQGAGLDYSVSGGTNQVLTWLTNSGTARVMDANDVLTIKYESLEE